uniref:C-type lectin domain-containing protein n=1 Tax=Panagrolaimus sp. PS1159 TaxID=55785 RepID=A0AC35GSZ8_9BILA
MLGSLYVFVLIIVLTETSCPNESFEYLSNCYFFNTSATGFAKAEIFCRERGGHLASIHDVFTNVALSQEFPPQSTEADFWIGANKLMAHGNWSWTDGTSMDFTDWKKREPQNITGTDCVALSMIDGYWSANDCFKNKLYVCSVPVNTYQITTTPFPTLPPFVNCSYGYTYFQQTHSCYGGVFLNSTNFTTAEKYCESVGAQLPSIHTYEEDHFLRAFTFPANIGIWIGLYSIDEGKEWVWSDGTAVDYIAWAQFDNNTSAVNTVLSRDGFYNRKSTEVWWDVMCKKVIKI